MKSTHLYQWVTGLLVIVALSQCADHSLLVPPGSPPVRLRVKTITQELSDNRSKISTFSYDAQGKLSAILTYQSPDSTVSEVEYSTYSYDEQNRFTQIRHEVVLYPRGSWPNRVEQYLYSYNATGQVSRIQYVNGLTLTFSYNGTNQPVGHTSNFATGGLTINGSGNFTFTGYNLTAYQTTLNMTGHGVMLPSSGSNSVYTHDDKVNPFYGIYVIPSPYPNGFVNLQSSPGSPKAYFGGIDNVLNLSQNNVLTEKNPLSAEAESISYQYQYNAANLPILRIKTSTLPLSAGNRITVETLHFDYESY
jgi:YD repeat-containing protein